jgi:ubiquinone/menaquinone biosynthesis C-methylase UbiE
MTAWEEIHRKSDLSRMNPHPEIAKVARLFRKNNVRRVLDLGCGAGRHLVYLAKRGFDVYGLDFSSSGLARAMIFLGQSGATGHFALHDMDVLPCDDAYFEAVISTQVIHHATFKGAHRTVKEIHRVLKDGGLVWVTLPVSKNEPSKRQKKVERGTFIPLDGREKGVPHHYFTREEISLLFHRFKIIDFHVDVVNHYSLLAQKRVHRSSI